MAAVFSKLAAAINNIRLLGSCHLSVVHSLLRWQFHYVSGVCMTSWAQQHTLLNPCSCMNININCNPTAKPEEGITS